MTKCICRDCGYVARESDFYKHRIIDSWCVCPSCRTPDRAGIACDAPGCVEESTCSYPFKSNIRHTCLAHSGRFPFIRREKGARLELIQEELT